MVKIGFTGTRNGMNKEQIKELENIIKSKQLDEFHHGMCVGSDQQAHDVVKKEKIKIVRQPPTYKKL